VHLERAIIRYKGWIEGSVGIYGSFFTDLN